FLLYPDELLPRGNYNLTPYAMKYFRCITGASHHQSTAVAASKWKQLCDPSHMRTGGQASGQKKPISSSFSAGFGNGDLRRLSMGSQGSCLRVGPNGSTDRGYRNTLVGFIKRRWIIELRHFGLTRMMQRDNVPTVFVEHRTTGASSFGRCPIVHAPI